MAKRKDPDTYTDVNETPSKRTRRTQDALTPTKANVKEAAGSPTKSKSVSRMKLTSRQRASDDGPEVNETPGHNLDSESEAGRSPIPKTNGTALLETPKRLTKTKSTSVAKADRSAKRKSAKVVLSARQGSGADDWDNSNSLADDILANEDTLADTIEVAPSTEPVTPSKRGRGRPKGARNKRTPTPEGEVPPEERYFFQTRNGPQEFSRNSFAALGLLSYEDYIEALKSYKDPHGLEVKHLMKMHTRAFLQWKFELDQGYSVCLYGWGSKRILLNKFATWWYKKSSAPPKIVVINGYAPKLNLRRLLNTIASATTKEGQEVKLVGQLHDIVDNLLARLTDSNQGVTLIINSIDGQSLRKAPIQALLARLAAHEKVRLVASADTPTYQLLLNSTLREQFEFAFHDATTYVPFDVEISPVDDVNELLGRKGRRAGGKEGVGFVLKSLPENARNLYRVLLTEIFTILCDGAEHLGEDADENEPRSQKSNGNMSDEVGIEYKVLYQKAAEEFICSSDMNFRFLLKEFHDHQMLTSKRDASGTELLGVPLSREEIQAVLEDLVVN